MSKEQDLINDLTNRIAELQKLETSTTEGFVHVSKAIALLVIAREKLNNNKES